MHLHSFDSADMCVSQDTMQVKWADPELQVKKKKAVDDSNADNRMVSHGQMLQIPTLSDDSVCLALSFRDQGWQHTTEKVFYAYD